MSSIIQTLPPDVINLIAAGEVIDSLAAVVRELVENSLDAEATRITVSLMPNLWQLQVTDNGKGMSVEDLRLCANAHSTSKIRDRQDLWKINSLGFRGEALHSIAQVAELEIFSRAAIDEIGWRVAYQEGKLVTEEIVAIASGTIITVANLFASLPVRRRALPSVNQQIKLVQNIIHQLALTHPGITWQVWQNQKPWFNLSPGMTAKEILPQILKRVNLTDLQFLKLDVAVPEESEAKSNLELVIGLPDRCHRHRPDWVKIAVNGRIVRLPELEQTIITSMAKNVPRDRYPVSFLHLHLPSHLVDWNRHPAKTEIYLHYLPDWQEQVTQAIEKALTITPINLPLAVVNQRVNKLLKVAEEKNSYNCEPNETKPKHELNLIQLKAVAQVNKTYIVVEHSSGFWLVEQHIAHERVLYEQIQDHWQLIPLKTPILLNNLNFFQLEQLERLKIEIEPFGEGIWAARNAPALLAQRDDCHEALIELSLGGDLQSAQVATACRSAIRNGTPLSLPEMQNLIDQWQSTRNPRTCPHGRPIYLSLEETSLARFFRRHWVIGKSHGI
ncbi:DNA mismatch repair protein MutL [Stanieria cyanosphaera PCC 7437]|uniref:DNA mismatch repair protein MutL n=1 Tax=Stanieria cyanosphaera (strain ATCC 29371 / PCC 7437) TaxID=111780 RepID=K9XPI8_STAC7|nr:DNA mismatch repair endonuclease MutL [Stanieria cyanosphaera]AFZ34448.1 DNA mismatch repair protein MutL [Stanieria cyanosphaera PCC 7437]